MAMIISGEMSKRRTRASIRVVTSPYSSVLDPDSRVFVHEPGSQSTCCQVACSRLWGIICLFEVLISLNRSPRSSVVDTLFRWDFGVKGKETRPLVNLFHWECAAALSKECHRTAICATCGLLRET